MESCLSQMKWCSCSNEQIEKCLCDVVHFQDKRAAYNNMHSLICVLVRPVYHKSLAFRAYDMAHVTFVIGIYSRV